MLKILETNRDEYIIAIRKCLCDRIPKKRKTVTRLNVGNKLFHIIHRISREIKNVNVVFFTDGDKSLTLNSLLLSISILRTRGYRDLIQDIGKLPI